MQEIRHLLRMMSKVHNIHYCDVHYLNSNQIFCLYFYELYLQFLEIEIPLKMMKNTFYFMLKSLFFLEIFPFLS